MEMVSYPRMKRVLRLSALSLFLLPGLVQGGILSERPYYWYKFDVSHNASSGTASLGDFGAQSASINTVSPWGHALATTSSGPYGSGFALGTGDWTMYVRAQLPTNLDNGVIWNIGTCLSADALLLMTRANDAGVRLVRTKSQSTLDTDTQVIVDYAGLSVGYHDITAVYTAETKQIRLYIDGQSQGKSFTSPVALTGDKSWQWFSGYGGCYGTTPGVGVCLEELRFYQKALTATDISDLHNSEVKLTKDTELTKDYEGKAYDLNGHTLTIPMIDNVNVAFDSSEGEPGQLVIKVAADAKSENKDVTLSRNLRLVKDGEGLLTVSVKNPSYTGGNAVKGGTLMLSGVQTADVSAKGYLGADDVLLTIEAAGTLDVNGRYDLFYYPVVLAGGTLRNGGNMDNHNYNGIGDVTLTADSKVVLAAQALFQRANTKLDLGGHTLAVSRDAGVASTVTCSFSGAYQITNGTLSVARGICLELYGANVDPSGASFVINDSWIHNAKTFSVIDLEENLSADKGEAVVEVRGTFKTNGSFDNVRLLDGATLDLRNAAGVLSTASSLKGRSLAFADGAAITVDLTGRSNLKQGAQVVSWTDATKPPESVTFKTKGAGFYNVERRADGLYLDRGIITIFR